MNKKIPTVTIPTRNLVLSFISLFVLFGLAMVYYFVAHKTSGKDSVPIENQNQDIGILQSTTKLSFETNPHIPKINVWTAQTPIEHAQGLSIVQSLEQNQGMLFIFSFKDKHSFWMKNMRFPIDILWIDENKTIVSIKENAHPSDYPETYTPGDSALYVLEVSAGFVARHRIGIGDTVSW